MSDAAPGLVLWLTGRPASGKTTIAAALVKALRVRGVPLFWLDSDLLREVLTPLGGYEAEARDAFYEALGALALRAAEGGVTVVVSATASKRRYRDAVRTRVASFVEVYVEAAEATVRARDPKGLYAGVDSGEVRGLPGVDVPYEAPEAPALVLTSEHATPAEHVDTLLRYLDAHGLVPGAVAQ